MSSTDADRSKEQIANHLQFLGYEVKQEESYVRARHPQKPNILVKVMTGGILHTSIWGSSDDAKRNRQAFLEWINQLNQGAQVVRYYADKDVDLIVEGWYTGGYDRTNYGRYLELSDLDFQRFVKTPETNRFIK